MKAIENVREKANQVINRYGKVIFTFLIFFTLLGTAQVAEAQSGLKINSLSDRQSQRGCGHHSGRSQIHFGGGTRHRSGLCHLFACHEQSPCQGIPARLDHRRGSHHGSLPDYLKTKSHENHA